jgi:hypothetical protein
MAGIDYLSEIRNSISPDEHEDDVVLMIDILAKARTSDRRPIAENDYRFSATIWCVIQRPLKPPQYRSGIVRVRHLYIGIATNFSLQNGLNRSFTPALLRAPNEQAAIALGVSALFNLPNLR